MISISLAYRGNLTKVYLIGAITISNLFLLVSCNSIL